MNTAQGNTVISQYVGVIFQMLTHLDRLRIFQQRPKRLEHGVAIQLIRGARVIMREGYVSGGARLDGKGHADHFRDHVIEASGLGVKGKQLGGFESD